MTLHENLPIENDNVTHFLNGIVLTITILK